MLLFSHLKVSGHSMEPKFYEGKSVFVSVIPYLFSNPKKGDVIVFKYGTKLIMKRVTSVKGKKYGVEGDNKKDSLGFGFLHKSDILGKVIFQ